MKKLALLSLLILCCFTKLKAQGYGTFGSAVYITKNGSLSGYNVTGTGINLIGPDSFSGSLGSFIQNSAQLTLKGGEVKSFKGSSANVCGSTLFYRIYPTGTTPASTFLSINLPFKAGCNGSSFADGYGACSGNDQKWNETKSTIDLTARCPGDYTIEIYYKISGSNTCATACDQDQFIGSATKPAASMTFSITGSNTAPTITGDTIACSGDTVKLTAKGCCDPAGIITWSNGATGPILFAHPGAYAATCTVNGCKSAASDTFVVTEFKTPAPTISGDTIACSGDTVKLTAIGCCPASAITWSNGTTGPTLFAQPGSYTAICTANGCTSAVSDTFVVTEKTPAPVITGVSIACNGETTKLTAKGCCDSMGVITWSNGTTGPVLDASEGTYTATCTLNGCTSSASNSITVTSVKVNPPMISMEAIDCSSGIATLTASSCCPLVTWSTGDTASSIKVKPGSYSAICIVEGCVSKPSDSLIVKPCPIVCPMSGNLLVNGSFEDELVPSDTFVAVKQPGWRDLQPLNDGVIETWGTNFHGVPAVSGKQIVELNYKALGTLVQDVSVNPNVPVTLTWNHRARRASPNEMIRVEIVDLTTNQIIDTFISSVDNTWQKSSLTFTPENSDIEIRFVSLNASGDGVDLGYGNLLDDVTLNYSSCICETPLTITGDTTVCPESFSVLTATGCATGSVSWTDGQGVTSTGYSIHANANGASYTASCIMPGCPDATMSAKITMITQEQCVDSLDTGTIKAEPISLKAWPNPVINVSAVKLTGFTSGAVAIRVTNINGVVISTTKREYVNGMSLPIDMSALRSGMYFIKVQQGNKVIATKVVKK